MQPNDGLWIYDDFRDRAQALDTGRGIASGEGQLFVQPGRVLYHDGDELMIWQRGETGKMALAQSVFWTEAAELSPNLAYRAERREAEQSLLIRDMQTEETLYVLTVEGNLPEDIPNGVIRERRLALDTAVILGYGTFDSSAAGETEKML